MSGVLLGRVTEAKGARVHVLVDGRPACPVLCHRRIVHVARPALVEPSQVCRFCSRKANVAAAQRENDFGVRRDASLGRLLGALVEANRTPAEHAWIAELVARASRPVAPAAEPVAVAPVEDDLLALIPARPFAEIRTALNGATRQSAPKARDPHRASRRLAKIHNQFARNAA